MMIVAHSEMYFETIELYTPNGWTLWYVNHILIKLFKNKKLLHTFIHAFPIAGLPLSSPISLNVQKITDF